MNSHAIILKLASALDLDLPEDKHRTGPRTYSLKSLAKALLFRHLLRLSSDRDLARKLQNFSELRNACGLKRAPHATTLGRARDRIDIADIFYQLVQKAKQHGLSRGFILTVDSTQFEAYLQGDADAKVGYCAAKDEFIFGYKAHIVSDAESELPVAVVLTPANDHDSRQFLPLMRRVLRNFSYEIKKLLADSGYDAAYIRRWLREHQITDVIDRNRRTGTSFGKPKDPEYKRRIASERVNSHAKDGFALERFTFSGLERALQHTYACLSAMLYSAISCYLIGLKNWRKLVL
jgi:IS5 family transposase